MQMQRGAISACSQSQTSKSTNQGKNMSNSSKEAFLNSVRLHEMWDNHLYADLMLMLVYLIQRP